MSAIQYLQSSMTLHKNIYQKKVSVFVQDDFFAYEKKIEKENIKRGKEIRKDLTKGYIKMLSAQKED